MNDISIDLETLGTRFDAPILSIGAAVFNRDTGKIGATYYVEVEFKSAVKAGRPDGDTIAWWMHRSHEARAVFQTDREKLSLATALHQFNGFLAGVGRGTPTVWGNGATFDITILEHAYDVGCVGLREPWHFKNIRDMRTIVDACQHITGVDPYKAVAKVGTHHNAKDDAVYQAGVIANAFKLLRGTTKADDDEL